jgi:hypothetical protein
MEIRPLFHRNIRFLVGLINSDVSIICDVCDELAVYCTIVVELRAFCKAISSQADQKYRLY